MFAGVFQVSGDGTIAFQHCPFDLAFQAYKQEWGQIGLEEAGGAIAHLGRTLPPPPLAKKSSLSGAV